MSKKNNNSKRACYKCCGQGKLHNPWLGRVDCPVCKGKKTR